MSRAAVPETSIDKDSNPLPSPNKVRFAAHLYVPPPACDLGMPKQSDKLGFRGRVSVTTDFGHARGSLFS